MIIQPDRPREVRIALVIYGGVSLAIYENGVIRSFYELVKKEGVFSILLELLEANAVIDVVAGTSAGGINGLFLAAALESGQEFKEIASLWRTLGDISILLRDPKDAKNAESLMDGDFFCKELIKTFEKLCTPGKPPADSPGEMDVFITGTDLDGHLRRYTDSQNRVIDDKEHRVVFHLQSRPGRKWLGLREKKGLNNIGLQAAILGTIARITAGFPLGFESILGDNLDKNVRELLSSLTDVKSAYPGFSMGGHAFVDGGVLDNKPFGPVIRAIFHHMPGGVVERRLFYVEPDPLSFTEKKNKKNSPISVGIKSLITIPGYEGIADDLQKLLEHNQRLRWLCILRDNMTEKIAKKTYSNSKPSLSYLQARIECICRSLVLDRSPIPSAKDYPTDSKKADLLDKLRISLGSTVGDNLNFINPYDVVYLLRKAFYMLYEVYGKYEDNKKNQCWSIALLRIGRIIKTLKIIVDVMGDLREELILEAEKEVITVDLAGNIFDQFRRFLNSNGSHWSHIKTDLQKLSAGSPGKDDSFLQSSTLTNLLEDLRKIKVKNLEFENLPDPAQPGETILDMIADILSSILGEYNRNCMYNDRAYNIFDIIDQELYPSEFISGIYELDEIKFVRVSPADARIGLSDEDMHAKIAGDKLAHFSAFLRREWRSNDIMQGRLDGICQIIESLLDDTALQRILMKGLSSAALEDKTLTGNTIKRCTTERITELHESWIDLRKTWDKSKQWNDDTIKAAAKFRKQLILAGQEDAFFEDIETIFEDCRYQEIKFGKSYGPSGTKSSSNDHCIECDARNAAKDDLTNLSPLQKLEKFKQMLLGSNEIIGEKGQVPYNVAGEYLSTAWLMIWGMLRHTSEKVKGFLDKSNVKWALYHPARFLNVAFILSRQERTLLIGICGLVIGLLAGAVATTWYYSQWKGFAICLIALFIITAVLWRIMSWIPRIGRFKKKKSKSCKTENP